MDFLSQPFGLKIATQEDRLLHFTQFQQRQIGGVFGTFLREAAQDGFRFRCSLSQGGRILDDLVILGSDEVPVYGSGEDGLEIGILFRLARFAAIEFLGSDVLEAGKQLKADSLCPWLST